MASCQVLAPGRALATRALALDPEWVCTELGGNGGVQGRPEPAEGAPRGPEAAAARVNTARLVPTGCGWLPHRRQGDPQWRRHLPLLLRAHQAH